MKFNVIKKMRNTTLHDIFTFWLFNNGTHHARDVIPSVSVINNTRRIPARPTGRPPSSMPVTPDKVSSRAGNLKEKLPQCPKLSDQAYQMLV